MKENFPGYTRWLLLPLSGLYRMIIGVRNRLYDHQYLKTRKFSIPVISVGNLTVGGTGKTPWVIFLSQFLSDLSLRAGIVSRGYGRKTEGTLIVHDGKSMLTAPGDGGDEPCLMAAALKSVPVIADENRSRGIQKLIESFPVDVVLLDDAFQHRKAARDLDILLINSREPAENYHLLPLGRLREPLTQSRRAGLIVYTKCTDPALPTVAEELAKFTSCPQITAMTDYSLSQFDNGDFHPVDAPINEPVFAFCGIGDPASFRQALADSDISPVRFVIFPDHQEYSESAVNKLQSQISATQCNAVITTEKDRIKLPQYFLESFSIYIIRMTIKLDTRSNSILTDHIQKVVIKKESNP